MTFKTRRSHATRLTGGPSLHGVTRGACDRPPRPAAIMQALLEVERPLVRTLIARADAVLLPAFSELTWRSPAIAAFIEEAEGAVTRLHTRLGGSPPTGGGVLVRVVATPLALLPPLFFKRSCLPCCAIMSKFAAMETPARENKGVWVVWLCSGVRCAWTPSCLSLWRFFFSLFGMCDFLGSQNVFKNMCLLIL